MRKGINGFVTINDFIEVVLLAEDVLNEKISFSLQ